VHRRTNDDFSTLSNKLRLLHVVDNFVRNLARDWASHWNSDRHRVHHINNFLNGHWVGYGDSNWHVHANSLRNANDLSFNHRHVDRAGNANILCHNALHRLGNIHTLIADASEGDLYRNIHALVHIAFHLDSALNWNRDLDVNLANLGYLARLRDVDLHGNCLRDSHCLHNLVRHRNSDGLDPGDSNGHLNLLHDLNGLRNVNCDGLHLLNSHRHSHRNAHWYLDCHRNSVVDSLYDFHGDWHVVWSAHRFWNCVRNLNLNRHLHCLSNWDSHRHFDFDLNRLRNVDRDWNLHLDSHGNSNRNWHLDHCGNRDRDLHLHNDLSSNRHRHLHRHLHRDSVGHILAYSNSNWVVDSHSVGDVDGHIVHGLLLLDNLIRSIHLNSYSPDNLVGSGHSHGHRHSDLNCYRDVYSLVDNDIISHGDFDANVNLPLNSVGLIDWSRYSNRYCLSANGLHRHGHRLVHSLCLHHFHWVGHIVRNFNNLLLALCFSLVLILV